MISWLRSLVVLLAVSTLGAAACGTAPAQQPDDGYQREPGQQRESGRSREPGQDQGDDREAGHEQGLGTAPARTGPTPAPPTGGDGTFDAAGSGSGTIGAGATLVRVRVEVEKGVSWGDNPVWKPSTFATAVDRILASPRGWTRSATSPVTSAANGLSDMSWSFRRVGGDDAYDVQIRLATPKTVDRLCGQAGMNTEGKYSCRFGSTVMINLGRWLRGAPGYRVPIADYRTNVINHEVGHFLGFGHAGCPEQGKPAPVMQTQTIDLGGCVPNPYPFSAQGRFITGPHE